MRALQLALGTLLLFSAARAEDGAPPTPPERPVHFEREVAPILARHCGACHGAKKTESGLRLDLRAGILAGGESGAPAVVPGKSAESLLLRRVMATGDEERMPPEGPPVPVEEVAILARWIDEGAVGPEDSAQTGRGADHWAFKRPVRPAVPTTGATEWVRNPIDAFVRGKLEEKGLTSAAEADKAKWLRRLSLDLVGLPPTVEELDAFLADSSPDAHERQVDRLLASPHYGERWGRLWLDAARYADSNGYEKDRRRNAWVYRDWVVRALNRDLPYDQFIIEQIAGDMLPGATQEQRIATGFLRNSMVNEEGAIDPEQFRMEAMFDRMDAIGKSILGVTIQCTQCHNHKFDPMSQEEYYRIFAYLNNAHEARPATYSAEELERIARIRREIAELEAELKRDAPAWAQRMAAWKTSVQAGQPTWQVLRAEECLDPGGGTKYERLEDESWLGGGYAPANLSTRFRATTPLTKVTGLRLELLTHPNLPAGGPGRSDDGAWALSELAVTAEPLDGTAKPVGVKLAAAVADAQVTEQPLGAEQKLRVGPVGLAIDEKSDTAWSAANGPARQHQDRTAVFELAQPVEFASGIRFTITLTQAHGKTDPEIDNNREIGRFRFAATGDAKPAAAPVLPRSVRMALDMDPVSRSAEQQATLFGYWRTTVPEFAEANKRIEVLLDTWPAPTPALTLQERSEPRVTSVLKRGDWLKPTKPVSPGVPGFLHPVAADSPPDRLTFARWLADRQSPTTARVIVNRIWQAYFGTGLVASPEDLGTQSEPPTHPELLDWLACELMDQGWSLKALHRLIATSAVYRQDSRMTLENLEKDPANRWLARGPRTRVDAELVRDVALAVSGLLRPELGGPSLFPPAPGFLFVPPASYEAFTWREETGPNRYRRSLYTFRRRSTPYPVLAAFDAPTGEASCVRRQRSNTPIQALVTLNEPVFFEAAQALALRTLASGIEDAPAAEARARAMFRRATGRIPTAPETAALVQLFESQKQRFAEGWVDPKSVAFPDPAKPPALPEGMTPTEMGAWTVVARAILNLDETITKE